MLNVSPCACRLARALIPPPSCPFPPFPHFPLASRCEAGDLGVLMDRAAHAALARALRGGASTAVTAAAVGAGALPALSSLDAAASSCSQSLSVKQEDVAAAMSGYTPPAFWQMGGGQKGAGAASADADGGWQVG